MPDLTYDERDENQGVGDEGNKDDIVTVNSERDIAIQYQVNMTTGECSCPHYQMRLKGTGRTCKHYDMAKRLREEG